MKNLARATATAGLAVAFGVIAVPSASAAVHETASSAKPKSSAAATTSAPAKKAAAKESAAKRAAANKAAQKAAVQKAVAKAIAERPVTVNVYYVMHDGRVVTEQGPGNLAAHEVENSEAVDMRTQNEPITTGDLSADRAEGPVTFEVEGSEQDTGEVS